MSIYSQVGLANILGFDITFTNEYDKNQNATIITPTAGKSLAIKGFYIGSTGTTGKVRLYGGNSNNTIGTVYATDNTSYVSCTIQLARNEVLKCQSTTGDDLPYFVLVNYTEE